MRSDPAADVHADGAKLLRGCIFANPNTCLAHLALCRDSEICSSANHHFFQRAYVPEHIAFDGAELQDRITDNLPRAVIGDVAATRSLKIFDALLSQHVLAGQ